MTRELRLLLDPWLAVPPWVETSLCSSQEEFLDQLAQVGEVGEAGGDIRLGPLGFDYIYELLAEFGYPDTRMDFENLNPALSEVARRFYNSLLVRSWDEPESDAGVGFEAPTYRDTSAEVKAALEVDAAAAWGLGVVTLWSTLAAWSEQPQLRGIGTQDVYEVITDLESLKNVIDRDSSSLKQFEFMLDAKIYVVGGNALDARDFDWGSIGVNPRSVSLFSLDKNGVRDQMTRAIRSPFDGKKVILFQSTRAGHDAFESIQKVCRNNKDAHLIYFTSVSGMPGAIEKHVSNFLKE